MSEWITSGLVEIGRRSHMQDSALKMEASGGGFTLKRVYSLGGIKCKKDYWLYSADNPRFEPSIEMLQQLGVISVRLVTDGVSISGKVENAGGLASLAALDGFSYFFLEGRLTLRDYLQVWGEQRRRSFEELIKEFWRKLNSYVGNRALGGRAVAAMAIETGGRIWCSWVGDPIIEEIGKGGFYRILALPDNHLWQRILRGEYDETIGVPRRRESTPLEKWDIFEQLRGSPLNSLVQALGQTDPLNLEGHTVCLNKSDHIGRVIGLGSDGIGHPRKRIELFQRSGDVNDFVRLLRREVKGRLPSDNVAYRVLVVK